MSSAMLERSALDEELDFDVPCGFQIPRGVKCPNAAQWVGMLRPCGCSRFACTTCKVRVQAEESHFTKTMLMLCAVDLRRVTSTSWHPL